MIHLEKKFVKKNVKNYIYYTNLLKYTFTFNLSRAKQGNKFIQLFQQSK